MSSVASSPDMRQAIQAALELLEAGDQRGAELVLLDALDALGHVKREWRCEPGCGRSFEWPGLLEAHKHVCVYLWERM